eukprot:1221595-Heterocapsa_arctica.AAC.1
MDLQQDEEPHAGGLPDLHGDLGDGTAENGYDRGQRRNRGGVHRPVREHGQEQYHRRGHE